MRLLINKTFTTRSIRYSAIKFFFAVSVMFCLHWLLAANQQENSLLLYFLIYIFLGWPLMLQSWIQFGRALRSSHNKIMSVFFGGIVFGSVQAVLAIFLTVIGSAIALGAFNFHVAGKIAGYGVSAFKDAFAIDRKYIEKHSSFKPNTPDGDEKKRRMKSIKTKVPQSAKLPTSITDMPENMTDYASYLENLYK